jgi:hypothetical protein
LSATESAAAPRKSAPAIEVARKWAFVLVPLIGLWELGAHIVQTRSVVSADEWRQARAAVESERQAGDLVVFAPYWADPLGREYFGSTLAGTRDEARPDESRYARAFEVSMRGMHADELAGWAQRERRKVGPFTITLLENPSPAHVLDDLVTHATPDRAHVFRLDRGNTAECGWTRGPSSAGGLGAGPAVPGDRFSCPGGAFVGESIIFETSYHPRRCLFALPGGHGVTTRVVFQDVAFGTALHGYTGLQYESERGGGADTVLTWRVGDQTLGRIVHRDGDGWKGFELTTADLAGKRGDLVAEVVTPGTGRQYCFEADTR